MGAPRFRFIASAGDITADPQFWRDVEASERLGSRFKANLYLRELCRTKAWGDASLRDATVFAREEAERELLREVQARGYRLFGQDLDALTPDLARSA